MTLVLLRSTPKPVIYHSIKKGIVMALGHFVYVYGTLRPGGKELHMVPGVMFDMGYYPGVKLGAPDGGKFVVCEKVEVSDTRLAQLDRYEGFHKDDPAHSLYLRVPYLDGHIYVYNQGFEGRRVVEGGDWLKHKNQSRGSAAL
jgi:gamma-glutamylcyclotransferase (GGCT)/AIG2-like uncharacterized protein YtfP